MRLSRSARDVDSLRAKPSSGAAKMHGARTPEGHPGDQRLCPHCQLWQPKEDDFYCAACGSLLVNLRVKPDPLVLIAGLAPRAVLTVENSGGAVSRVRLGTAEDSVPGLAFEPTDLVSISPGETARFGFSLDESRLPGNLSVRDLAFFLFIDDDERRRLSVAVTLKQGPRPVLAPDRLDFGAVTAGSTVRATVTLGNRGGIPLKFRSCQVEGLVGLKLAAVYPPFLLVPGERIPLEIEWRVPADSAPAADAGLRLRFDNHSEQIFVPISARLERIAFAVEPKSINHPAALSKQDTIDRLAVSNQGTVDLEILGVASDQPWIEIAGRVGSVSLNAASENGQGEVRIVEVICHPQALSAGLHRGAVTVSIRNQAPQIVPVSLRVLRPEPFPNAIGIDFGTTNSVVALLNEETQEIELVEEAGSPLIPSVLLFVNGPETYKVGEEARREAAAYPDLAVRSVKRVLGSGQTRSFFGRDFKPEELVARILRRLVEKAEAHLYARTARYYSISQAVVTVPSNFLDPEIRSLLRACDLAGLDTDLEASARAAVALRQALGREVRTEVTLDEPSAAALLFLKHLNDLNLGEVVESAMAGDRGLNLLVFDYGGGTLDIAVANLCRLPSGASGLKILANQGDNTLGGDGIDFALMGLLLEQVKQQHPGFRGDLLLTSVAEVEARRRSEAWPPDLWASLLAMREAWRTEAERIKVALSKSLEVRGEIDARYLVDLERGEPRVRTERATLLVRQADLERVIAPLLSRCQTLVQRALDLAEIPACDVDLIFHAGRQSFNPLIRAALKRLFPHLPSESDLFIEGLLKVCVAQGAVLYGRLRESPGLGEGGLGLLADGRRLPLAYGFEATGGLLGRRFEIVVPRGSEYPGVFEHVIPRSGWPPGGRLKRKVYENRGSSAAMDGNPELRFIGQIDVDLLSLDGADCTVRFELDANRRLEVFVNDDPVPMGEPRSSKETDWLG